MQEQDVSKTAHVLIADDRPDSAALVARTLRHDGIITTVVLNVAGLDRMLARLPTDLVVLDLKSSKEALSICRRLTANAGPPVIIIDEGTSDARRAEALEAGAEYLLSREWKPRGLLAHVRAVLRRHAHLAVAAEAKNESVYSFLGWRVDLATHELTDPDGDLVDLTRGELALLRTFLENPRRVLARKKLMEATGQKDGTEDRTVDVQISRLRRKLGAGNVIRTVRSGGYMFLPPIERT
jgi:two-component system OmpR family response regulator